MKPLELQCNTDGGMKKETLIFSADVVNKLWETPSKPLKIGRTTNESA